MRATSVIVSLGLLSAGTAVLAQAGKDGPLKGIYTCTTADGRKLTSDRPIPECSSREQRILNADGSQRATLPPFLSPEERAAKEAADRRALGEQIALQDAIRRDRTLMQRYRDEPSHNRARNAALDDVTKAVKASERRIKELAVERKPFTDEAEFYKGKTLPAKLKQSLDANDASVEALQSLIENQKAESVRINSRFDAELARLRKLWSGTAPGTLPPLDERHGAPAPAASRASSSAAH